MNSHRVYQNCYQRSVCLDRVCDKCVIREMINCSPTQARRHHGDVWGNGEATNHCACGELVVAFCSAKLLLSFLFSSFLLS